MPDLSALQERIGCVFKNPNLLLQALTHKSYSNERRNAACDKNFSLGNNERLEFLGDTVLALIIGQTLFLRNPNRSEGDLSKMRAHVVNGPVLAGVAKRMGLGPFLLLGAGEEKSAGRDKPSLLADALESVIAAIYLDQGLRAAEQFVLMAYSDLLNPLSFGTLADYKTQLQEFCQEKGFPLPTYQIIDASGPDHQKRYEIEIKISETSYGIGTGNSKKEAQQQSAKIALGRLRE